jgi:hypothetical protein
VPRTVAEAYFPVVRYLPLALALSLRIVFLLSLRRAAPALPLRLPVQEFKRPPASLASAMPFWLRRLSIWKIPATN